MTLFRITILLLSPSPQTLVCSLLSVSPDHELWPKNVLQKPRLRWDLVCCEIWWPWHLQLWELFSYQLGLEGGWAGLSGPAQFWHSADMSASRRDDCPFKEKFGIEGKALKSSFPTASWSSPIIPTSQSPAKEFMLDSFLWNSKGQTLW
jgi:hypothetical protein